MAPPKGPSMKSDKNKNLTAAGASPPPTTLNSQHNANKDDASLPVRSKVPPRISTDLAKSKEPSEPTSQIESLRDAMIQSARGEAAPKTSTVDGTVSTANDKASSPHPTQAASHGTLGAATPASSDRIGEDTRAPMGEVSSSSQVPKGPSKLPGVASQSSFPKASASRVAKPSIKAPERSNRAPYLPAHEAPKTPENCLKWLLEWALSNGLEGTMTTAIGPEFASHLVTFDVEALQSEDLWPEVLSAGCATSPAYFLADWKGEANNQLYATAVRYWLDHPEQAKMKEMTEELIDKKLKELSRDGEKIVEDWDFDQKVGHLAGRQNMRLLEEGSPFSGNPSDTPMSPTRTSKHGEFQVHLRYVINGDAKETRVQVLYFDFLTPFYEFVKALQDSTVQCVIPPLDSLNIFMKQHSRPNDPNEDHASASSWRRPPFRILRTEEEGGLKYTYYQGYRDIPSPSKDRERGYTIADGAWMYQRALLAEADKTIPTRANEWTKQIANEEDYKATIRDLYKVNKTARDAANPPQPMLRPRGFFQEDDDPDTTYVLCVMHTMEYTEFLNYEKRKEIEKKEEDARRAEWTASNPHIPPLQRWSEWVDECFANGTDPYARAFGSGAL